MFVTNVAVLWLEVLENLFAVIFKRLKPVKKKGKFIYTVFWWEKLPTFCHGYFCHENTGKYHLNVIFLC